MLFLFFNSYFSEIQVYWESNQNTLQEYFSDFEFRIKKNFFEHTQVYDIVGYTLPEELEYPEWISKARLSIKKVEDKMKFKFIHVGGVLRLLGEETPVGTISLSVSQLEMEQSSCN